jgi:O-acetylserine/cysteine efflux transporter
VVKVGLGSFPPLLFSSLRFTVAAFPAVLLIKRHTLAWRWIVAVGLTMGMVVYALIFVALDIGMPAGLASLVVQVHVLFTFVLSAVMLRDRPRFWQWIGTGVAFVGICLLVFNAQAESKLLAVLLVLGSGLAWAVSTILLKRVGTDNVLRLIVWMSIVPPVPLLILSLIFEQGHWQAITQMNSTGLAALLYSGWVSTLVGFAIWARLIRLYSPNQVAPFALLVPILSMVLGALCLQETYTIEKYIASGLILTGLALLVFHQRLRRYLDDYDPKRHASPPEVIFDYFRIK